jgi:hypothetical protein
VDNYVLYVLSDLNATSNTNNNINQAINSSLQSNQTQLIPLIGKFSSSLTFSNSFFFFYLRDIARFDTKKEEEKVRERENKKLHLTGVHAYACKLSFVLLIFFLILLFFSLVELQEYLRYIRNQQFSIHLCIIRVQINISKKHLLFFLKRKNA